MRDSSRLSCTLYTEVSHACLCRSRVSQNTDLMRRQRPKAGLLVTPHQMKQRLSRHLKALPGNVEQPRRRYACKLLGHQALMLQ